MSDCTGYGFGNRINLCLLGAVGDGNTADLEIQIDRNDDFWTNNFDSSKTETVHNWDGNRVVVDLTSILAAPGYGIAGEGSKCEAEAQLTITPGSGTTGTMLLEFRLYDCTDGGTPANVYDKCGGAGPHIISEMSTFDLSGAACAP